MLQSFLRALDRRVTIVDLAAADPRIVCELIQAAPEWGSSDDVFMLATGLHRDVLAFLRGARFRVGGPKRGIPSLLVKTFAERSEEHAAPVPEIVFEDLDAWDLQLIDSDAY